MSLKRFNFFSKHNLSRPDGTIAGLLEVSFPNGAHIPAG